jgi:hypothetical protein
VGIPCFVEHGIRALFEDPAPVVDRDLEPCVATFLGSSIFVHLWVERTIPLCPEHCFFQLETLFHFTRKKVLFSQDMTIFVRSRGIKSEYPFFFFFTELIFWFFFFYSWFATLFGLCMLLLCALCDLDKSET